MSFNNLIIKSKNILKDTGAKLYKVLFPLLSVLLIIAYLRMLFHPKCADHIPIVAMYFLFIPIVIFELVATSLFNSSKLWPERKLEKNMLVGRILLWFILFILAILMFYTEVDHMQLALNLPSMYWIMHAIGVYKAEKYISIICSLLWVTIYYIVVVRLRKCRILISFVLPVLIIRLLVGNFYHSGGLGDYSSDVVEKQAGVEIFFNEKDFPKIDYFEYRGWAGKASYHPRKIYIDKNEKAVFAFYANTLGHYTDKVPTILKINLETKKTRYFISHYTRDVSFSGPTVLIAPWYERKIFELDKKDLSLLRTFHLENNIIPWKVRLIRYNEKRNCIYLTNDMEAELQKYDYKTGKLIKTMRNKILERFGTIELWLMAISDKRNRMYINSAAIKDIDIIEVDLNTLEITRTLNLGIIMDSASELILDEEKDLLYFQEWANKNIYEIDINSFKVKRVLKGVVQCRKIRIDKKRNCLYLLNYFYGTLSALDLKTGKKAWKIKVGGKPYGLDLYNDTAFVNSRAGIIKVDLKTVWEKYSKFKK